MLGDPYDKEEKTLANEEIDETTIAAVIAKHFKRTCDLCTVELKTLPDAIEHYRSEHQLEQGYLTCCRKIFRRSYLIVDHVRWHLNPNVFK